MCAVSEAIDAVAKIQLLMYTCMHACMQVMDQMVSLQLQLEHIAKKEEQFCCLNAAVILRVRLLPIVV